MALKIPTTFRLTDLKSLAFKCGIASSGTKTILSHRLNEEISSTPRTAPNPTRVLSIDMGIRNLAYCVLDVPKKPVIRAEPVAPVVVSVLKKKGNGIPQVQDWRRLAVSTAPDALDKTSPKAKEAFDPATLSQTAYALLRSRLLPLNPTHILIERQRFRSMGSKHILEWTIRVNMFESILYAVLCTLKAEGIWDGQVVGVTPGKVGPFWLGEEEADGNGAEGKHRKERRSKSAKVRNKGLKIDLVRRWLDAGDVVGLGSEGVETVARQYMEKWDRGPGGRRGKREGKEEDMGKLDDLADCLLQGMAWVHWEENKRLALKSGVEALLDQPITIAQNKDA